MVLATHFALKVDCGGAQSLADVVISLSTGDFSYAVRVDGVTLSVLGAVQSLRCGSVSEHRLEVEIPKTRPAGLLLGTVSFSATTKN